jgi:predicted esterase YcpF (UPF0227 family)
MQRVKLLFYFNGFNSAIPENISDSPKINAVAELANNRDYRFIPVSICFRDASGHADEVLSMVGPEVTQVVFCGSSMGGWFARIVQLRLARARPEIKTATIGFNPAYDLSMHGYLLLGPQRNYVTLEDYVWTKGHSAALRALETEVTYGAALPFFVYVDKGDEVIGWERSATRHTPVSRFVAYEGGCHSFDHFNEALEDFDVAFH